MNRPHSFTAILAASVCLAAGLGGCGGGGGGGASAPSTTTTTLASLGTPTQVAQTLSPGINLGNTLEAINGNGPFPYSTSQEGYWGNPPVNQAIFNAYAAAGFKSVRIPVAWSQYADANNNISPFWLARVKQVVDYARNAGLYVIINIHWDGGWMNTTTYAAQAGINAKVTTFWTQIANEFQGYDNHLIFAGTNEVGQANTYGAPTAEYCAVQNSFNQTFVNAVRATGGANASRYLAVQAYFTNIDYATTCNANLPTDSASSRLMMEVHYYDPYDFTINGSSTVWEWGATATDPTDPAQDETWANESYVDGQFQKMQTTFVNKGVPVIMGEYGAYPKPAHPVDTYTNAWAKYVTHSAFTHGVVPMWWDTGGTFDRTTGAQKTPTLISTLVSAAK